MLKRSFAVAVAVAAVLSSAGCGEPCGPGGAPSDGIEATFSQGSVTFGEFTSSPNNDCPPDEGGPTSITVAGEQVAPEGSGFLTLCLPRPDEIGGEPIPLGDDRLVQVIDASGEVGGCRASWDRGAGLTGTVSFSGFCDNGTAPEGYAIELDATLTGTAECAGADAGAPGEQPITLTVSGTAAVGAPAL